MPHFSGLIWLLSSIAVFLGSSTGLPSQPPPSYAFSGGLSVGPGSSVQSYYVRGRSIANPFDYSTNNGVLVFFGQSNFSNVNPTVYTPSGPVFTLSTNDGVIYQNASPTLGTSTGSPLGSGCTCIRIADGLISAGKFKSVIVVPSAIGGTAISPVWASDSYRMIAVTFLRLAQAGLTPNAVLFGQGESDTGAGTTQVAYAASLASFISNVRATGYAGPIFIAHQSWNAGSTSSNVTNAQDAAVNHPSGIWAGPNGDAYNATFRQADNTHYNDTGAANYSADWVTALHAFGAPF
jgi:hypothetical protein